MKRLLIGIVFILLFSNSSLAQRFAYVNTEYVLSQMPEYDAAQKQLDALATQWANEIEAKRKEIDKLYRNLQAEKPLLTQEMIQQRKSEIAKKEEDVNTLQQKRFGYEGDLFKKRQELIKPIQDKIYDAIEKMAKARNYDFIFDKASAGGAAMLYADGKFDRSNDLIKDMGYIVKKPNPNTLPGVKQDNNEKPIKN
jgi:outer membrane protein